MIKKSEYAIKEHYKNKYTKIYNYFLYKKHN